jgi:DNA repair exonuclease SbcCD ATPase subunit
MDQAALDLPFDQYQRYRLVTDIIEAVRPPGERLSVLDVGGRTALLRRFLTEDEVHLVDVEVSGEAGLVLGDGSRLPFADDSVDVLVTFDTLEHVPPPRREAFLSECSRVARRWVVIAGPYQSPEVDEAERLLATFIEEKLEQRHRYLAEHAANGLPDRSATERALQAAGAEVLSIGHANLERWLALMCLALYMDRDAPLRAIASQFYRFYNAELYASDHAAPVYRHAVIGAFDGAALPDLEGLLSTPVAPAGALDLGMGLVRQLMQYDVERDAVTREFARLEEVNRDLELDLDGHKRTLVSMREVQEAQTRMIGELREQCLELRAVEEDLEAELEREREEGEEARGALELDLAGHKARIAELEEALHEHGALASKLESELERERSEGGAARASLEEDLAGHKALLRDQERALTEHQELVESLESTLQEERSGSALVQSTLEEDLRGHKAQLAELESSLGEHRVLVADLESSLLEERGEAASAVRVLEADLAAHKQLIEQLVSREGALQAELAAALESREVAECERETALHEGRARALEATEQAREAAELRKVLESEARLRAQEAEVREALSQDLEGHRGVVEELRLELEKAHVVVRELDHAREVIAERSRSLEGELEVQSAEHEAQVARAEVAERAAELLQQEVLKREQQLSELAGVLAAEREEIAALRRELRSRVRNLKRAFGPKPKFGPG